MFYTVLCWIRVLNFMCLDLKCKYADFPLGFQKKRNKNLVSYPDYGPLQVIQRLLTSPWNSLKQQQNDESSSTSICSENFKKKSLKERVRLFHASSPPLPRKYFPYYFKPYVLICQSWYGVTWHSAPKRLPPHGFPMPAATTQWCWRYHGSLFT